MNPRIVLFDIIYIPDQVRVLVLPAITSKENPRTLHRGEKIHFMGVVVGYVDPSTKTFDRVLILITEFIQLSMINMIEEKVYLTLIERFPGYKAKSLQFIPIDLSPTR